MQTIMLWAINSFPTVKMLLWLVSSLFICENFLFTEEKRISAKKDFCATKTTKQNFFPSSFLSFLSWCCCWYTQRKKGFRSVLSATKVNDLEEGVFLCEKFEKERWVSEQKTHYGSHRKKKRVEGGLCKVQAPQKIEKETDCKSVYRPWEQNE